MELLKSTLYLREYFYTTLNGTDISYRALSYKELENIQSKYTSKYNQTHTITVKTSLDIKEDFSLLNQKDIDILYKLVIDSSTITAEEFRKIEFAVEVVLADSFKDDNFKSCKLCQERKLDLYRNCPLLDVSTHDVGTFYIVAGKKLEICPMDDVNSPLVNDAFKAHSMYDKGLLPSAGGLYDQPMFFVEVSSLVKGIINNHQAKEMEKK